VTTGDRRAAIVGVYNTVQARRIEGRTTRSLALESIKGALADAGLALADIDGINAGLGTGHLTYDLKIGPAWQTMQPGIAMVLEAAAAVEANQANVVVLLDAQAAAYRDRAATAPWTRPSNEWVAPWGMFTAAEFALIARRHMYTYGTTPHQLATVAAAIRSNGSAHPDAVYTGKGEFTPEDVLASRMVADPFHLLDCSTTSEGGCALVVTTLERARDLRKEPVLVLGGGAEYFGPAYQYPPAWDLTGKSGIRDGDIGARAARRAFERTGLTPADVDVLEFYDPFSFEIIRQLEALGFCGPGEGGPYVEAGHIAYGGKTPVTTDGGTMSFSHPGASAQMLQRVIRAVQQVRGECVSRQVPGAKIGLATAAGAGAMFHQQVLVGALS
jgi:acetyl-CoA acetyltransferase